jgi:DNA-binding transcriptional ArsR family regulator
MRRDVFQAIAYPTRREIINLIAWQSMTPNAIADSFKVTRQAISKHMQLLYACGLVTTQQVGRERYYQTHSQKLKEVSDWLEPFRRIWESRFNNLDELLKQSK